MKRLFAVFVLTPAEQRLVIFVVLLLIGAAWSKHHRDVRYEAAPQPTPNLNANNLAFARNIGILPVRPAVILSAYLAAEYNSAGHTD